MTFARSTVSLALPLPDKDDYISDPEAFRLRPDGSRRRIFRWKERGLWDVAYTTRTTSGQPSPFYNTAHDAYAIWDQARRCNEAEGLTRERSRGQPLSAGGLSQPARS